MLENGTHPALNFVIIGGGPTGVELAGAISDIARLYMAKDFRHINPAMAQVLILEGSPRILAAYPDDLQASAVRQLKDLGVRVRTGAHVTDVQPGYVMIGNERVDAVVTLWAAGVPGLAARQDARRCNRPSRLRHRRPAPQSFRAPRDLRLRRPRACRAGWQRGPRSRTAGHADGRLRGKTHYQACIRKRRRKERQGVSLLR